MHKYNNENVSILVVDDEESLRNILQRSISLAGYNCMTAGNIKEALDVLKKCDIDVVITDIVMPGESGISLLSKIKEKYNADVMVMTGYAEDLTYEDIIEKGAHDFLQKPFSTKELLVRLRRVIRERVVITERNKAEINLLHNIHKLSRIFDETVNALGSALEKRDPYTAGHQQRVAHLACAIAEEVGLTKIQVEGVRIAGLLHDIGKFSVPTDILNKPSKLSKNEFNLIMEHPLAGYDILNGIEFDQPIANIVLQHHEFLNASGYPYGIGGNNILVEAKILTVSDVVEAICSHRPYRPALGKGKALEEIEQKKGILYEPVIVDACLRLFNEKNYSLDG
jgi:putative nucleotidyltransferase with HDIG domain